MEIEILTTASREPKHFTPRELAARWRIRKETVLKWMRCGHLSYIILPGPQHERRIPLDVVLRHERLYRLPCP